MGQLKVADLFCSSMEDVETRRGNESLSLLLLSIFLTWRYGDVQSKFIIKYTNEEQAATKNTACSYYQNNGVTGST